MHPSRLVSLNPQPIPPRELVQRLQTIGIVSKLTDGTGKITEQFDVCCVGHNFFELRDDGMPSAPKRYIVQDYLLDQSGRTGGGAAMVAEVQCDFTASSGYTFLLKSGCGKSFRVNPPSEAIDPTFAAYLGRQVITPVSDTLDSYTPEVMFQGLAGATPALDYATFGITNATNSATRFQIYGRLTGACSFKELMIDGAYPHRTFDPGTKWYKPLSYADPLGPLSTGEAPTFVLFSYITEKSIDPGRFVTLE